MKENESRETNKNPVIFDSKPSPLPLPYSRGVKTLTARQALKYVSSIIPHWTSLVTRDCYSSLGVYAEVISPPALCCQTRILLGSDSQMPGMLPWRIGYMRDGKEHVLDLFTLKNRKDYFLKLGRNMVPCTLAVGTVQQGRSSVVSFGCDDMHPGFMNTKTGVH